MTPDIIVTAPLPPFLYDPLKADYRCHDYAASGDKSGLLASDGARMRGLVQGGGTVTPTTLLDALPKLEIISVFGVAYLFDLLMRWVERVAVPWKGRM